MVHRIRTGFGDAKETYRGDDIMEWFEVRGIFEDDENDDDDVRQFSILLKGYFSN
jgi:hypothetical protein